MMTRLRRIGAFLIVAAMVGGLGANAALSEDVQLRASARSDLGKLVFTWKQPVAYELVENGQRISLRFGRAMEASLDTVKKVLGGYARSLRTSDDGRSVEIVLTRPFDVYSYDSGRSVILEIAPREGDPVVKPAVARSAALSVNQVRKTSAQSSPAAKAPAASTPSPAGDAGPKIRVRSGAHAEYTRIVFDWTKQVKYTVQQDAGVVTVSFARPASLQLSRLQRRLPPLLGGIRVAPANGGTKVTLSVPASSKVRHFLSGPKVVVDIPLPKDDAVAKPLPPAAEKPEVIKAAVETPTEPAKTEATPPPVQAKAPPPAPIPAAVTPAAQAVAPPAPQATASAGVSDPKGAASQAAAGLNQLAKPGAPAPLNQAATGSLNQAATGSLNQAASGSLSQAATGSLNQAASGSLNQAAGSLNQAAGGAGQGARQLQAGQPAPATAPVSPAPASTDAVAETAPEAGSEAAGDASLGSAPAGAPPAKTSVKVAENNEITLRFDWDEPVAAAVFRRAGYMWIAFDKPVAVDVDALSQAGKAMFRNVIQLPVPNATVLRMLTTAGANPLVGRAGLSWLFKFGRRGLEPKTPIETRAQPDSPVGARLFLPVPEPGRAIGVTDPEVGDNFVIVPVIPLGHGVAKRHIYPQVELLPAAQGVVVIPSIDDLRVRPLRQGVEMTSSSVLQMTAVSAGAAAGARFAGSRTLTRLLKLEKWKLESLEEFNGRKQQLQLDLALAKGDRQEKARLDMARFYLANGFGAETIGVLGRVSDERPGAENTAEFRMLRGAANYLMARLPEAIEDLDHESLADSDEASFWRAAAEARSGLLSVAAVELRRTATIPKPYPPPIGTPLMALVTEALVVVGDVKQARQILEVLNTSNPSQAEKAQILFAEAKLLELGGDFDGAVGKLEEIIVGPHSPVRSRAVIARMEMLTKLDRMTAKEAILELEDLRYSWRGGEFEFNLLRRLGGFYLDEGLFRHGLTALRQAATYFRDNEEAPQVTQQMADAFIQLYLEDAADQLPPVKAIAIYEEFKELTPAGARGDEMIRKLADRLVKVDLLPNAAALLEDQVRFRLQGAQKAQVAARLALVYILANEYDKALDALAISNAAGQSEELQTLRRHLQARALMGAEQPETALELLKKDKTQDAELLRTEIYWNGGDWNSAALSLKNVVKNARAEPNQPLDEEQALKILNWAVTLTLSGNERGLGRLRRDYGAAMDQSSYKDAFTLVAAPTALGLISPESVAGRVKQVENFRTFLAAYEQRLKEKSLSDVAKGAEAGASPDESDDQQSDNPPDQAGAPAAGAPS